MADTCTDVVANSPPGFVVDGVPIEGRPGDSPGAVRERAVDAFQDLVADVCGILHHSHARLVALTAEALAQKWWHQSGIRSPEHWLCWQTGLSPGHAAQIVAAARRRHELPATIAAFDAGELALDQVMPIVRWAPAWADRRACDLARRCTVTQLRAALARYPFADAEPLADANSVAVPGAGVSNAVDGTGTGAAGEGSDPPDPSHAAACATGTSGSDTGWSDTGGARPTTASSLLAGDQPVPGHDSSSADLPDGDRAHPDDPVPVAGRGEYVSLVDEPDGTWRLSARLDADHGLVLDAALREIRDAAVRDFGRVPSGVDALVQLAGRSLDAVTDRSRRDRYRVHVTLDERYQLVDPFGHALPDWMRDLITCDTTMSVTWQRNGAPIAQGSTSETIPAATRRHVLARDGGCRVPGCGRRTGLDLHHVIHRRDLGTNDPWNLVALCGHHHRMHHRGHLGITGNAEDPDGISFTTAAGHPIVPDRLIRPPSAPPLPPDGPGYRHPIGERLQLWGIQFRPPPPTVSVD